MTSTLNAPVYEVKPESAWYQAEKERRRLKEEFYKEIEGEFPNNGFGYYNSSLFGVMKGSDDYEAWKHELTKNPDKNGLYRFKKTSKHYKRFSEKLSRFDTDNPFKSHDVFGYNNTKGRHWVDGRWFYSVKDPKYLNDQKDEVRPVEYAEYLKLITEVLERG